ncbi:MAG: methyltransferase [Elusimicrobia bacterium]|nr:methyltransferase [Elusimicrobiota bacterium]
MRRTDHFSDFNRLAETALAYRSSKALLVALRYDLFTNIYVGMRTARSLSLALGLNERALEVLLNALAAMGYLVKRGDSYANTPPAAKLLVTFSPQFKGNNLRYQEKVWDAWSDLGRVVKSGRPRLSLLDWLGKDAFAPDYVMAMHDIAKEPAAELARKLGWAGVTRTLDVGCGPGTYSAAFAKRRPGVEAVLFDLRPSLAVARRILKGRRDGRFVFRTGNYLKDGFGSREFDLILMSHITHNESACMNQRLVAKAFKALRPGGRLVIHDFVLGPNRDTPAFSALFALHLLVFTGSGTTYTVEEYSAWMRAAGFRPIGSMPVNQASMHPSVAIVGSKPRPCVP